VLVLNGDIKVEHFSYLILVIVSAVAGGGLNIISKGLKDEDNLAVVSWSSLFTGIILFIVSRTTETEFIIKEIDFTAVMIMIYVSVFCSFLSYLTLYYLLRNNETTKIMPYNFLRPIVAIFAGFFINGEPITTTKCIGIALVIIGIVVSQYEGNIKMPDVIDNNQ
jgi:drug/metabolite transporter (DMT)-like permease